jgi:hypothetical protein
MHAAPRDLVLSDRVSSRNRTYAAIALLVAFLVVLLLGVRDAGRLIDTLDHRRDEVLASRSDPADIAGHFAGAFRRFRATIRDGERFALVFAPDVGRDQKGFYRLVSLSYLYPAIAVDDPSTADAVMVFGEPPPMVRSSFEETAVVDGVWLGRRRA